MRWLKRLLNIGRGSVERLEYDSSHLGELTVPPLTWSTTTLAGCGLSLDFPRPLVIKRERNPEGWIYRFGQLPVLLKDRKLYSPDPIVVFITAYRAIIPDSDLEMSFNELKEETVRELPPRLVRIGEVHVQNLAGRPTIIDRQRFPNGSEICIWSTICDGRALKLSAHVFVPTPPDWRDAPLRMIQTLRRG